MARIYLSGLGDSICDATGVCLDTSNINVGTTPIVSGSSTEMAALQNLPSMSAGYSAAVQGSNVISPPPGYVNIPGTTTLVSTTTLLLGLGAVLMVIGFSGGRK